MSEYLTVGDIQKLKNEPRNVVTYALDRYGPPPIGRVGIARVWSISQLDAICESLARTRARSTSPGRKQEVTT